MQEELLRFDKKQKYLIFDTETESLNLFYSRPYQIAWAIADLGQIYETRSEMIWWDTLRMSKGAAQVTRFNYHKYESLAKDPKMVWEEFAPLLENKEYKIVFHNGLNFDVYQVKNWAREIGENHAYEYLDRAIDSNCLAKAAELGLAPPKDGSLLAWQYRMGSIVRKGLKTSIKTMAKKFDIQYDENKAHDAEYDITLNYLIFKKLLFQVEI